MPLQCTRLPGGELCSSPPPSVFKAVVTDAGPVYCPDQPATQEHVKPKRRIVDFRTHITGLSEADFKVSALSSIAAPRSADHVQTVTPLRKVFRHVL